VTAVQYNNGDKVSYHTQIAHQHLWLTMWKFSSQLVSKTKCNIYIFIKNFPISGI